MVELQKSTLAWTLVLASVLAVLCAYIAWAWSLELQWISYALAWPTLSLFVVVLLYAGASLGANTGRWMTREHAPWLQPVLWPFKLVAYSLTVLMRRVRGESVLPSRVVEGLWLGMRPFEREAQILAEQRVHCIVDLCAELGPIRALRSAPFERLEVPTMDRCPPSLEELDRAVEWIAAQRAQGRSVYVHCAFGRGRSAMVTAAALLRLGAARSVPEAMELLRSARPSVSVKGDQRRALDAWAKRRANGDA
ncbi:MAG: dual specificity protein phosphatase family protein [Myxococcales bacterium]|nr:dual specificity protein phosphatase family protein [Myxococcales bacterium]